MLPNICSSCTQLYANACIPRTLQFRHRVLWRERDRERKERELHVVFLWVSVCKFCCCCCSLCLSLSLSLPVSLSFSFSLSFLFSFLLFFFFFFFFSPFWSGWMFYVIWAVSDYPNNGFWAFWGAEAWLLTGGCAWSWQSTLVNTPACFKCTGLSLCFLDVQVFLVRD